MASTSAEADALFAQWQGQIVPRSFNAGFVTLSYIVSLIGAGSTLELINRRTAPKGRINQYVILTNPFKHPETVADEECEACCSSPQP